LITASVVLGPGSIVASSRAGAESGYRLLWLLITAALLMAVYTSMGARLGCALGDTPLAYLAKRFGRWLSVIAGLSAFLVTAGFQFGNNLGAAFAVSAITGTPQWIWPLFFTALALFFLIAAKQFYALLEKLMMLLVAIMIVCFFANLFWTGIDIPKLATGLIPRIAQGDDLIARAMFPTTFSAVAAFYQAYLVKAKQWQREDIKNAVYDAWAGIATVTLICTAIIAGAAEVLYGADQGFGNVGDLAQLLKELLGPAANVVFCLGLAAAAFSSFIVNAVIGGALLADGLGLDSTLNAKPAKVLAAIVMIVGCAVAIATLQAGAGTTTSLLVAQASTLVAAPLCAIILLLLTSNRRIMGDLKNNPLSIIIGCAGLGVVFWLCYTWVRVKLG